MLTTKQEQKIEEVAYKAYGFGSITPQSVVNAIVTSIKAYDKLKDVEEVKTAAENYDDCYVVFRPVTCLTLATSMRNIRVFSNIREMVTKLTKEKNEYIYIAEEEFIDNRTNWQHCHYVLSGSDDVNDINARTGICDCKTFKKG